MKILFSRMSVGMASSGKLIWFSVLSCILLASAVIHPFHEGDSTVCLVKNLSGIPCPGCGMTRAFLFIGHGDIRTALRLNINSLLVFSIVAVLWAHTALAVITGKEIRVRLTEREELFIYVGAGAITISGWLYNIFLNTSV